MLCGIAINNILPKSEQFYDKNYLIRFFFKNP